MGLSRRGFIGGLLAVVSAPAIVRVGSLMTLPKPEIIKPAVEVLANAAGFRVGDIVSFEGGGVSFEVGREFVVAGINNSFLSLEELTQEAINLWKSSNNFISSLNKQFDQEFAADQARIGSELKIRLPNDVCEARDHQFV